MAGVEDEGIDGDDNSVSDDFLVCDFRSGFVKKVGCFWLPDRELAGRHPIGCYNLQLLLVMVLVFSFVVTVQVKELGGDTARSAFHVEEKFVGNGEL